MEKTKTHFLHFVFVLSQLLTNWLMPVPIGEDSRHFYLVYIIIQT